MQKGLCTSFELWYCSYKYNVVKSDKNSRTFWGNSVQSERWWATDWLVGETLRLPVRRAGQRKQASGGSNLEELLMFLAMDNAALSHWGP
jgi:hypothetical protein